MLTCHCLRLAALIALPMASSLGTITTLVIKTNSPNLKGCWQVTGIRNDAFANRNRSPVEEAKPEVERGYYLHPDAFDQPEQKGIQWAQDPEGTQQLKVAA